MFLPSLAKISPWGKRRDVLFSGPAGAEDGLPQWLQGVEIGKSIRSQTFGTPPLCWEAVPLLPTVGPSVLPKYSLGARTAHAGREGGAAPPRPSPGVGSRLHIPETLGSTSKSPQGFRTLL